MDELSRAQYLAEYWMHRVELEASVATGRMSVPGRVEAIDFLRSYCYGCGVELTATELTVVDNFTGTLCLQCRHEGAQRRN